MTTQIKGTMTDTAMIAPVFVDVVVHCDHVLERKSLHPGRLSAQEASEHAMQVLQQSPLPASGQSVVGSKPTAGVLDTPVVKAPEGRLGSIYVLQADSMVEIGAIVQVEVVSLA